MKKLHKIICTVITVSLLASVLVVPASAKSVAHKHRVCQALNTIAGWKDPDWKDVAIMIADELRARSSVQVAVDFADPDGIEMSFATCTTAITTEELDAAADAYEEASIPNLTVFKQREVRADKEINMDITLWPCGPKNATVVLFRPEGETAWTVVSYAYAEKTIKNVTLPGSGSFVVAMSWGEVEEN